MCSVHQRGIKVRAGKVRPCEDGIGEFALAQILATEIDTLQIAADTFIGGQYKGRRLLKAGKTLTQRMLQMPRLPHTSANI